MAERGRTVPVDSERALSLRADALWISWPLDDALAGSATATDPTAEPKKAPSMPLDTLRMIGELALNRDAPL